MQVQNTPSHQPFHLHGVTMVLQKDEREFIIDTIDSLHVSLESINLSLHLTILVEKLFSLL